MKQKKQQCRERVKNLQKQYNHISYTTEDIAICENVCHIPAYISAKTIFCFVGTEKEIHTNTLIEQAWKDNKRVLVPRCMQKGIMFAYEICSFTDLELGAYGIQEPKSHCLCIPKEEIDFAVIPCVSCDKHGNRLGHGGGYYDRYLEQSNFETAVLCREDMMLDYIPMETHDKKMDWVVTEKAIIQIKKAT